MRFSWPSLAYMDTEVALNPMYSFTLGVKMLLLLLNLYVTAGRSSQSMTIRLANNLCDTPRKKGRKWNESGFRPPLCTYRLNWARRTSWGWWDDWDDTVLQKQDSKFEPWRSEAEHATSRSRRLPTILTFTRGWGRNIFVSFKLPRPGTEPRTLAWKAAVLTTTLGPPPPQKKRAVSNKYSKLMILVNEMNRALGHFCVHTG